MTKALLLIALVPVILGKETSSSQEEWHKMFQAILEPSEARRCIIECRMVLDQQWGRLELHHTENGLINSALFNTPIFRQYCSHYKDWEKCRDVCKPSAQRYYLDGQLADARALCKDFRKEFLKYQPCYWRSDQQQTKTCDNICGGKELRDLFAEELQHAYLNSDPQVYSQFVNRTCQLDVCQIDCREKVVLKECKGNYPAASFFRRLLKRVREVLRVALNAGAPIQECLRIIGDNP